MPTTPRQLVYFQPTPKQLPVAIGEIAQFDEAEDDVEDGCVAVRYRGRVMSAPLSYVRPVL